MALKLKEGDFVTGQTILTGRYLGLESLPLGSQESKFHKVFDTARQIVHYIPVDKEDALRKLPSKQAIHKYLRIMSKADIIDTEEIDGSRYKYLKEKSVQGDLKDSLEVFHDLSLISSTSKLSVSEKKLFNTLKESIVSEISFVLEMSTAEAEMLLAVPS